MSEIDDLNATALLAQMLYDDLRRLRRTYPPDFCDAHLFVGAMVNVGIRVASARLGESDAVEAARVVVSDYVRNPSTE